MVDSEQNTVVTDLVNNIRTVAARACSEEDLRIGVEKLLEPALKLLGVEAQPRYERRIRRTILTAPGRADALYGQAVIEYEPPGKFSTQKGINSTRKQLEGYLLGLAGVSENRDDILRRIAGIGLDGRSIFFLRYRGDKPDIRETPPKVVSTQLPLMEQESPKGTFSLSGPYQIDEESVNEFLLHLRALRRRPLGAEELADQFGPKGQIAHDLVSHLYHGLRLALESPEDSFNHVNTFFQEWSRIFGIIYGQDLVQAEKDAETLAQRYGIIEHIDLKSLLFAIHTYYALFMKLLAAELLSLQQGALLASVVEQLPASEGESFREKLVNLEQGTYFESQGIRNFLEADFFGWYLWVWNSEIEGAIRDLARALLQYEPATGTLLPEVTRDLLKKLYQYLLPKELRHDLGEYYTPDWLADLVLDEVGYSGNPNQRLLDPACGSGTFLVKAIRRALDHAHYSFKWRAQDEKELVEQIVENIVGFDLNPLAVIASRTNYLLALGTSARHLAGKDLPVYLCDSILTPQSHTNKTRPFGHHKDVPVPTTQKEFWIPEELIRCGQVGLLCNLLEKCIANNYRTEDFVALSRKDLDWKEDNTERSLSSLYEKIQRLETEGKNGIWARIIKNAFAPIFRSTVKFDYIVGNPPWINWESLTDDYRDATRPIWETYGLIKKSNSVAMGKSKRDIAMLFVVVCSEQYLKDTGILGFLLPFTIFKSQAGSEFRNYLVTKLAVARIHDLVELFPFEGAINRTSMLVTRKGITNFPIPSTMWSNPSKGLISQEATIAEVYKATRQFEIISAPIDPERPATPWMMTTAKTYDAAKKIIGQSTWYKAHEGINTALNAVFWVDIISKLDGKLHIQNTSTGGLKKRVSAHKAVIDQSLVYPLIRGRDVSRWRINREEQYIIIPTDDKGGTIPSPVLRVEFGDVYQYFYGYFSDLINRGGEPYKTRLKPYVSKTFFEAEKEAPPFYWLFNAQPSLSPYKVVWKRIAGGITGKAVNFASAVIGPENGPMFDYQKPVVLNDSLIMISCPSEDESYYVCGILNSSIIRSVIASYTYELRMETHISQFIKIPKFNPEIEWHIELASLSRHAHELAKDKRHNELAVAEQSIDKTTCKLYGLSDGEYGACLQSLKMLAGKLAEEEEEQ